MDMLGFTSEPRQRDLDIVYQCIMEPVTPHKFLQLVLGSAILLESSMEFTSMKDLLKLEVETYEIADILRPFHASVLLIEENKFIRLVHHSARSFFSDFNRCRDERFQINSTLRQTDLALKCLSRMTESLRKHIIGLEDPVIMNENITDLDSRLAVVGVTESVQYACRHWATHLQFATTRNQKLNDSFKLFCETGLLPWLEVMSLLRQYDEALAALRHAETWIQNRDPSDEVASLLRDMSCFATTYQNVIMGNAAAIYSIALPLSYPSQLYDRYHDEGPWLKIPLRSPVNSWTSVFRIISPNAGEVNDVAITHDSKYIVSGLDDYSARLYALGSGACIKTYEGHSSYVQSVSLSPNNRLLASGSYDRTMRIWDTKTGVSKSTLEGHTYIVFATDFSPDSMYIVTGGGDRTVRLWDAKSGSLVATMEGHEDYVRSANFSPNGRMILSASDDSTIRLWDVTHHMSIATLEGHSGYVYSAVFSPNNQLIASGGMDKTVRIWNAESHSLIHTLKGHDEYVHCVAFSSDSKYVVSSSGDCTIRIWDVQEGSIQRVLEGHRNATRTVMFTPDQMYIVSGSADSYIRVWNWSDREGNPISSVPTHSSRINLIEFSPDGRIVASAGGGGEVHLWDVVNMAHITELKGASELINSPTSLSVSSDSRYVTLSSGEKSVKWDMTTHEVVPPPPSPEVSPHNSPQQSPHQEMNEDNKEQTVQYHIGMTYGTIYAYRVDPNEGTRQKMLCSDSPVTNVSASSGYGYFLALGTTGGYVTILDFSSIISFESLFSSEGESAEPPQQ
ncbi:hypothetical protein FRC03_000307 [Tulasnella sp. 419]|nr:hypothetical protein FRC03_000307 [Tulasnella sp. 419]